MKNNIRTIILSSIACINIFALYSQSLEWAKSIGGSLTEYSTTIKVDNSGCVYTMGNFSGTADFDPGVGVYNVTSIGIDYNVYVQKLSSTGELIWVKTFGGNNLQWGYGLEIDNNSNLIITGEFKGSTDFDPSNMSYVLTSNGQKDVFIEKLDSAGNFLWAKTIGNYSNDIGYAVTVDDSGSIYTTGSFSYNVDFDPGVGSYVLASTSPNNLFVQKLDASGNFIWAKKVGNPSAAVKSESIKSDKSSNLVITGYYNDMISIDLIDFDPGIDTTYLSTNGNYALFILKLDSAGNFLWVRGIDDVGNGTYKITVETDATNNIIVFSDFEGTADFDPTAGVDVRSAIGVRDGYILKLDSLGNYIWCKILEDTESLRSGSLVCDSIGSIYCTGSFYGTVDFDPSANSVYATAEGSADIFILKLDTLGNFEWNRTFGGAGHELGQNICIDSIGTIYSCGDFLGSGDYDPGPLESTLTPIGNWDVYVLKLGACNPSYGIDSVVSCNSYTWIDGNTYYESNNDAIFLTSAMNGCDSIVALELTILHSSFGVDQQTACGSYLWLDGNTYFEDNDTAIYILPNLQGCDSVITLNLQILEESSSSDFVTACDSYTWIDGNTYLESNYTATLNLQNVQGCDSIITLNLTINTVDDLTLSSTNESIYSNCNNANYQWLDCQDNFSTLFGEINQVFVASSNGFYAVEITQNGCVDTTSCVEVNSLDILNNSLEFEINIVPNPTDSYVEIEFKQQEFLLNVYDVHRKLVMHGAYYKQGQVSLLEFEKGVYFFEIITDKAQFVKRIIKI